nr:retrovirus-related Pol polyprotein from transposon TNT 1-94 [Tanacetum cinerariifolium]
KIIKCDNGTEFKNSDLNQFCGFKGIKRVLVTKPHNKTPYELLHGRLPSIGFMRPFSCPVTILNTLDPLGKFQGKVDEGFLVGYSVCSKAFRVFNSRTRIVQETLHVNFMENKPNVAGSGPAWLFDIDSLSQTKNYHLVITENQYNSNAGFQDTKKAGEEGTQTYHDDDIQKSVSPDIHSSSSGAQTRKQGDKTENKDKGKSHVVTIIGFRDLNAEFKECNNNSSNGVNAASSSVSTPGQNSINSTNDFSTTGPSNAAMLNLEDLSYDADDVGAEANINNLESIISLYGMKGIKREFSVPRTPQQNGIAERKNKTLIEAAKTMLADLLLPIPFWAEAVNTASYVQNRMLVTKPHNKTPYELLHGRTPSISFMRPFGCHVTILNTLDSLGKFEEKVDKGFLIGYSINSKAFRVFNSRTRNQTNPSAGFQDKFDAEKAGEEIDQQYVLFPMWSSSFTNPHNYDGDDAFDRKEHDVDAKKLEFEVNVSPSSSAQSRKQDGKTKIEAKGKSLVDSFIGYRVRTSQDCSDNSSNEVNAAGPIVPTVGQNSLNSTNTFSAAGPSNAADSPTYGKSSFIDASQLPDDPNMPELEDITYSDDEDVVGAEADFNNLESFIPEERIDYEEVFAPVARIEAIRLFLAYASFIGFMVYQMDVKSAFLYRTIEEEVYVCQPLGFEDPDHPDKVYKVVKALYGLHQASRACQDKYVVEILRPFGLTKRKSASTPIDTEKPLLNDPGEDVDVHIYRSMIGSLMYLTSSRLDIMFACKKQTVVATYSTEAEYVAAASCCAQVLWIQNQLLDYGANDNW